MRTTEGANRMSLTAWRKSSFSEGSGTDCVEVAWHPSPSEVAVRDSKNTAGPMLVVPHASWRRFLDAR